MFENRLPRRILGLKTEEVTGDQRKLQNEELHNLYPSTNIIRVNRPMSVKWVYGLFNNDLNYSVE
jgi:hypothetical protein